AYYYPSTERIVKNRRGMLDAMNQLDLFYGIAKLRYACELINRQNVLQEPAATIALLHEVQTIPGIQKHILFQLYQALLHNLQSSSESDYQQLKPLILQHLDEVEQRDQLILMLLLINCLSRFIKAGAGKYLQETLHLYKYGIHRQLFIVDRYFEKESFINIVDTACKLKEFDWASAFIEEWKAWLESSVQNEIVLLAEALLCFGQSDFGGVIERLRDSRGINAHQEIRLRLLLISSYYEVDPQKYDQVILSHCKSFNQYVQRNQTIEALTKTATVNYTNLVQKLTKGKRTKSQLLAEIQQKQAYYFKQWLLRKVNALEEK
ncbi:MAG: hypothetical protein AAGD05_00065, partial [Bacteroidota bacterium]